MMTAYDELYLEKARTALGRMLDFAVCEMHYNISEFWNIFLASEISSRFETGDFTILVGKSGTELACEVLESSGIPVSRIISQYAFKRSKEYWCGWALAYYQWKCAVKFSTLTRDVGIERVLDLYAPYHEMDILQFCDKMDILLQETKKTSNLKAYRNSAGLSQSELAGLCGIPVRTIQQYEQRKKNINKANVDYLLSLARVLGCDIPDLLEIM